MITKQHRFILSTFESRAWEYSTHATQRAKTNSKRVKRKLIIFFTLIG